MNIDDCFPSKYISANDIANPITVRMREVLPEEMDDRKGNKVSKPVLYFANATKGLVLNKTNATTIGDAFGSETNEWGGHRITLYKAREQAFGEMTDCVRVRIPEERQQVETKPEPAPQQQAPMTNEVDDAEIPF
jgi:hypothetical protein